ncbi:MAG: hypothetical protein NWT02_09865 [Opitutales bacterium]|jgi:hypothetical protein|nr:hypothetical protein [Opitutales bacterium]MDP4645381.1 hypothetical protein [Opitutales bacterium]MDP4777418.1 hypothetical protein [Opitutales bacterium]MDP4882934.1 hypothetical protein [Opitutales bacterium]MDP5080239.1 hypothetical protein [Opitutales bacterium]
MPELHVRLEKKMQRILTIVITSGLLSGFCHLSATPIPPSQLDRELVQVVRRTEQTEAVLERVHFALSKMPESIKEKLRQRQIHFVITPTQAEIGNQEGGCGFYPKYRRIVVPETIRGKPIQLARLPIITLHEAGHAYDSIVKGSQNPVFQAAYLSEAGQIPKEMRQTFKHFLQEGNKGPVECFASLFARKYWRDPDALLDALEKHFPQSYRFVQELESTPGNAGQLTAPEAYESDSVKAEQVGGGNRNSPVPHLDVRHTKVDKVLHFATQHYK